MSDWREAVTATPRRLVDGAILKAAAERAAGRGLAFRYEGPASPAAEGPVAVTAAEWLAGPVVSQDVLVSTPLATAEEVTAAADRARERAVAPKLSVDHFAHVELAAGGSWPEPVGLMIEIALGPARFGGRPGRDAVDLATVIDQTDGVTLAGLSAAVASKGMAEALHRTGEQLAAEGFTAGLLSAASRPSEYDGLEGGGEVRGDGDAAAGLAVRVLARPSLETCVIDAGTDAGLRPKETLTVARAPGRPLGPARVRSVERGRTLLTVDEQSGDVLIGDVVVITAEDGRELGSGLPAVVFGGAG